MNKFKEESVGIDLYSIGREIMKASQFEEMYYKMEEDRNYWRDLYQESLDKSFKHNQEMMVGVLELGLNYAKLKDEASK